MTEFHLYVSGQRASLRIRQGMPWRARVSEIATWHWRPGQALEAVADLPAARWGRPSLHVYAGAALCRMGAFDVPSGVRTVQDIAAVGRAKLVHDLGLDESRWRFHCDRAGNGLVACALRADAFDAVTGFARDRRFNLVSIRPFAAVLFNAVQRRPGAPSAGTLLAAEADGFSVLQSDGGQIVFARSMLHDGQPGAVRREVSRLRMRENAPADDVLAILMQKDCQWENDGFADLVLSANSMLRHARYPDFRDLMFQSEKTVCG